MIGKLLKGQANRRVPQPNPIVDVPSIVECLAELKGRFRFGEGAPNLEAREDIKISDVGPII